MITSPHNEQLKEIRKLAAAAARQAARVRRRGRGPARGRRRGRLGAGRALRRCAAAASTAWRSSRAARERLAAWARARARSASTSSAGRAAAARCACALWGVARPRQRRHGAAQRRWPSAPSASRSGPGSADPFGPKAVRASMGAIFAVPVARVRERRRAARRGASRSSPRAGEPLAEPADGEVTLVVGAERDGLPAEVVAACDDVAHIPIARRVAERRDGGDGRALRAQLGCRRR